jgi:dolichyl-phosphate-mannose--protein O-mannosyl transferase
VQLQYVAEYVLFAIHIVVLVVGIYAFINAAMQRADAYPAAGKMTKNAWMGITGGAVALALVTNIIGLGITGIAITAVAAGIYLVDVRPKLLEVQGKSR